jgi:Ca2+-binding RTX toxin-like protein
VLFCERGAARTPTVGAAICGSAGSDVIHALGRNTIFALSGNDVIYARNEAPDEIDGGSGRDRAVIDRSDSVYRVEKVVRR